MRVLFFLLVTVFYGYSFAQVAEQRCNTEDADSAIVVNFPWYGNNELLLSYVDSIEAPFNCTNCRWGDGVSRTAYQIPVNVVIYEKAGYPNISNEEAEDYIASVNDLFKQNNVFIHLYLRCYITRVLNSDRAKIDNIIEEQLVFMSDNKSRSINLHFVSETDGWSGSTKPPWLMVDYSIIVNTESATEDRRNTTAHEIGHAFGLLHTFNKNNCRNDCWQEPVSRTRTQEGKCLLTIGKKKCSVNGDCLCDTDADVESDDSYVQSYTCSSVTFKSGADNCKKMDNYGDSFFSTGYKNSLLNIMSYWHGCRQEITKMQRGVMYKYVEKRGIFPATNNHVDFYKNADLDAYEPDGFWFYKNINIDNQRKKIDVNSQQYHTFHYAYNNSNNWEACDVDWVYFQNSSGSAKDFIIQTMEVSGKPKPDTKITLYPVNSSGVLGTVITSHDDINTSNLFSKITRNLANGYYAVKIENKVTSTSDDRSKGHYYIRVDEYYDKTNVNVTGSNTVCSSLETYYVSNIPSGSTVTWYTIPASQLVFTYSGNSCSVMLNGNASGEINLYVVVTTSTPCVSQETFVKTLRLNKPQYQWYGSTTENIAKANSFDEIEQNLQCYGGVGHDVYWLAPFSNYDNITWTKITSYPTTSSALWSAYSTDKRQIKVLLRSINATLTLKAEATNTCGTETKTFNFATNGVSCALGRGVDSTTMHEVDYYDAYMSNQTLVITYKDKEEENQTELSSIILSDKMGNIILEKTDGSIKENKIEIDLSRYKSDNYFLLLLYKDGNIEPQQIVKF